MVKRSTNSAWEILWYFPLILSVMLAFICEGEAINDSIQYMIAALEFTQGNFDYTFRPGLTVMYGLIFEVFGASVKSAAILHRLFYITMVVIIYVMSRYLYNKQIAFSASLVFVTSYELNFFSMRGIPHVDPVHPFFVILFLFLSMLCIDRRSPLWATFAGLAFFYGYLVKVTILPFAPFPFLYAFFCSTSKPNFRWSTYKYPLTILGVSGIMIIAYLTFIIGAHQAQAASTHSAKAIDVLFSSDNLIGTIINGFFSFWERFFFRDTFMGVLFLLSWLWLLIRSFSCYASRAILLLFILFLPAAIYLGLTHLRIQQGALIIFLSFIPVGVLIYDLTKGCVLFFDKLVQQVHGHKSFNYEGYFNIILIIITVSLSFYQIAYSSESSYVYLKKSYIVRALNGQSTQWHETGRLTWDDRSTIVKILEKNATEDDVVLTGWSYLHDLEFLTGCKYRIIRFPFNLFDQIFTLHPRLSESLPEKSIEGDLLFLWPLAWRDDLFFYTQTGQAKFLYLDEKTLLNRFKQWEPDFVALDRRFQHFQDYLEQVPGVIRLSDDPPIFQINEFQLVKNYKPHVAYEIGFLLEQLLNEDPENYAVLRNEFFPDFFGLTPEQVDAITNLEEQKAGIVFIGRPGKNYQ